MKIRKLLLGFILIVGLFQNESMAQINYYINSQGIPINASAVEAKQRLANGENYLGEIRAYPSTTNPSSWIRADGRLLNINQYLPLYGMLQNRYGGDGINTFAVPKLVPIDSDDSTNNVNWSIGGDKLKAIGLLGSLNNYNVQFIRNNVNQFSLTSTGIVSNVDYTTSGNITLQKGNPRLRLRDTGAGGHTGGFDLHVNGDEFLIDDNTHSRNILRNYLNGSVHTTDFDAEVFNFKNGATNYAKISNTGLFLNNLTTNYIPKHTANGLANSLIFDNGTNVGIGTTTPTLAKLQVNGAIYQQGADGSGVGIYTNGALRFLSATNFIDFNNSGAANNISFRNGSGVRTDLFISSTGNVGIGPTSVNASAKLEVTSTTKGVLLPRMTTTQINAIASPANGLMVYNTTLNKLCIYENTAWRQVTTTAM